MLVASVRHPLHVVESVLLGARCGHHSVQGALQLLKHPLTDKGLEGFLSDWNKLPEE